MMSQDKHCQSSPVNHTRGDSEYAEEECYYATLWSSDSWGTSIPNHDEKLRLEAITKLIQNHMSDRSPNESIQIIDVGCGRGWLTNELVRFGIVIGIDPVLACIERARQLFPQQIFEVIDVSDVLRRRGPETFDLVICSEVIEHVPYEAQSAFLGELACLVKQTGQIIMTTPRRELWKAYNGIHKATQPVEDWLTERKLDELARNVGLKTVVRSRVFKPHLFKKSVCHRVVSNRFFAHYPSLLNWPPFSNMKYSSSIYQVVAFERVNNQQT